MAATNRLTAVTVRNLKEPGLHPDGGNLYLQVTPTGSRSWIFRYKIAGKQRSIGLGAYPTITLEAARRAADLLRAERAGGTVDPLEARRATKAKAVEVAKQGQTFEAFAETYIDRKEAGWRNPKHRQQWRNTLAAYAYPTLGAKVLADITADDVAAALEPIWAEKPETASRVRGRVEKVLGAAISAKLRAGPNPAAWRDNLEHLLAERTQKPVHHAAMPYADVPGFAGRLLATRGNSAAALLFAILTAARSGEVLGATWAEVDLEGAVWSLPASRMKAKRPHRVPLAPQVVTMLRAIKPEGEEPVGFLFPGAKPGRPLSVMALEMAMRRMGQGDYTPHGFRSAFRDWCAETTSHPREVAELSLAHAVGTKVEKAYARSDLLERRRPLMREWCDYVLGATAEKVAVVEEPEAVGSSA